jgi:hypothetical protein
MTIRHRSGGLPMRPLLLCLMLTVAADAMSADGDSIPLFPRIAVTTSAGDFTVELDGRRAPISVANFVQYVVDGAYEGSVFHRVIPGDIAPGRRFQRPVRTDAGPGRHTERVRQRSEQRTRHDRDGSQP